MPTATTAEPFVIECPWCGAVQKEVDLQKLLAKFALDDLGQAREKGERCATCGGSYRVVLKNISYRVAQVKGAGPSAALAARAG